MRKEAIVLPGGAQQTFSGQVRSAASAQGSLDASFTPGKMGFEAKGSLEAVLLQARGETVFDFDKYGITVGVEGALNAVAVGVSGGAVAQHKNGTIRTGVGLGFSALFGGRASFSVSINAPKLLDAINPWRTFGTSPRP